MKTRTRLTICAALVAALLDGCGSGGGESGSTGGSTGGSTAPDGGAGGPGVGGSGAAGSGGTGGVLPGGTGGGSPGGSGGTGGAGGSGGETFSRRPGYNTAVLPDPRCAEALTAGPGPFASGVLTVQMGETPVEIWYPVDPAAVVNLTRATYDMRAWLPPEVAGQLPDADVPLFEMDAYRDAPASQAHRFPIVIFSHGLGGYRSQSSFLMSHLAQWGYVVAAPEHPERGLAAVLGDLGQVSDNAPATLVATHDLLVAEDARAGGPLAGRLNLDQIALSGHSMGGGAVAADIPQDWADTWLTLASAGFGDGPDKPLLMMGGTHDGIATRDSVQTGWDRQSTRTKRLVFIEDAGHLAFTDICAIGREKGGVLQIAVDHGVSVPPLVLQLGSDGCHAEDLPPEKAWPIIRHAVLAQLLAVFPTPTAAARFDEAARACFDGKMGYLEGSGPSVPSDGGVPPEPDTGMSPAPDAGTSDPNAGVIDCYGAGTCDLAGGQVCCVGLAGAHCAEGMCGIGEAAGVCDGPEDCGGQNCCVGFPAGAACNANPCAQGQFTFCHADADCNGNGHCLGCTFPGGALASICADACPF